MRSLLVEDTEDDILLVQRSLVLEFMGDLAAFYRGYCFGG